MFKLSQWPLVHVLRVVFQDLVVTAVCFCVPPVSPLLISGWLTKVNEAPLVTALESSLQLAVGGHTWFASPEEF